MLVVAAEGMVDVEQEDKVLGLLQMGILAYMLEQLRGQITAIGCDVNKPVKSSLHSEKVRI